MQLITAAVLNKSNTLKVVILSKREKFGRRMQRWRDVVVCDEELMHHVAESMRTSKLIVIEHAQGFMISD